MKSACLKMGLGAVAKESILLNYNELPINREVKHDVYGKRQTAKMRLLPSLFGCLYGRVKLFVFAMNSRRSYSTFVCFIYGLEEKNSKSEVFFAVCRLPLTSCLTSLIKTVFRVGLTKDEACHERFLNVKRTTK